MPNDLREQMFRELRDQSIFNAARDAAQTYADQAFDRRVFPGTQALDNLKHFDERLPELLDERLRLASHHHLHAGLGNV